MNATDRCDRCGAQAYVSVAFSYEDVEATVKYEGQKRTKVGGLLFCGHHYQQHEVDLNTLENAVVTDERHKLDTPIVSGTPAN